MSVTKTKQLLVPTLCVGMQPEKQLLVPTLCVGMQPGRSASLVPTLRVLI